MKQRIQFVMVDKPPIFCHFIHTQNEDFWSGSCVEQHVLCCVSPRIPIKLRHCSYCGRTSRIVYVAASHKTHQLCGVE